MAKRKSAGGYVHKHNPNPKAHDSAERTKASIQTLQIKRLQKNVDKLREDLTQYKPQVSEERAAKSTKLDPHYELKGAARPARDMYKDPNYRYETDEDKPINIIHEYSGRMWEHAEGQKLLSLMLELSIALHNIGNRTKDAVKVLKDMISEDPSDHLFARHRLLRLYLDNADADKARELLDQYPNDKYCCFTYSRALIEFISLSINEDGASVEVCDAALLAAYESNPYALWMLLHNQEFQEIVHQLSTIDEDVIYGNEGSFDDAIISFDVDHVLWIDIDGAIDWLSSFAKKHKLIAPILEEYAEADDSGAAESDADSEVDDSCPVAISNDDNDNAESQYSQIRLDFVAAYMSVIKQK